MQPPLTVVHHPADIVHSSLQEWQASWWLRCIVISPVLALAAREPHTGVQPDHIAGGRRNGRRSESEPLLRRSCLKSVCQMYFSGFCQNLFGLQFAHVQHHSMSASLTRSYTSQFSQHYSMSASPNQLWRLQTVRATSYFQ